MGKLGFKYDYNVKKEARLQKKFSGYMDEDGYIQADSKMISKLEAKHAKKQQRSSILGYVGLGLFIVFCFRFGYVLYGAFFIGLLAAKCVFDAKKHIDIKEAEVEDDYNLRDLDPDEVPYEQRQEYTNIQLLDNVKKDMGWNEEETEEDDGSAPIPIEVYEKTYEERQQEKKDNASYGNYHGRHNLRNNIENLKIKY